jgi:hypothetical protein
MPSSACALLLRRDALLLLVALPALRWLPQATPALELLLLLLLVAVPAIELLLLLLQLLSPLSPDHSFSTACAKRSMSLSVTSHRLATAAGQPAGTATGRYEQMVSTSVLHTRCTSGGC